jgi:hypothetical protein
MALFPAHKQMLHRLQRMRQKREQVTNSTGLMVRMRSGARWITPAKRMGQLSYWFPKLFAVNYEASARTPTQRKNWFDDIAA